MAFEPISTILRGPSPLTTATRPPQFLEEPVRETSVVTSFGFVECQKQPDDITGMEL